MVPRRAVRGIYDSISTKAGRGAVLDPRLGRVTGFLLGPCVPWCMCYVHWAGLLLQAVRTTTAPFLTARDHKETRIAMSHPTDQIPTDVDTPVVQMQIHYSF